MNTDIWEYFYKISPTGDQPTNLLYTPLLNKEKNVLCMWWNDKSPYQEANQLLNNDLINFFFDREVNHLTSMQSRPWSPKLLDVDKNNKNIFIEFNKETLNHIVFNSSRNIELECPDWQEQIIEVVRDIVMLGYYKMSLYPHCFFIDQNKKIKTIDFYACVGIKERYINRSNLEGMIGVNSVERFNSATVDNKIDFKVFFENTVKHHLNNAWPVNPLCGFHEKYLENKL